MHPKLKLAVLYFVCALACVATTSRADETAERGRGVFNASHAAVVTIQVVVKTSSAAARSSTPRESKRDVTGTVVDASGLIAIALSSCDPTEIYQRIAGEEFARNKIETEVSDVKILLEDGTELPAEIVLRDKDFDLAFIRPKTKPATPMAAVDLSKSSPAQLLDDVITLNRLNRASGRSYAISVERVSAVVQKPRTFYVPDGNMTSTTLGSPVFALDGKIVGLVVMRAVNGSGSSNPQENLTTIILPAEDILKAAKQAPEAKPEEEKKDAPKEAPKDAK